MIWQQGDVNPEMLILARKSRCKTQGELAKDADVTQATISKYEAGLQQVDESVLLRLAEVLDYPPRFFKQTVPIKGPGVSEVFHRKRLRLSSAVLQQSYALAEVRRLELAKLLESCVNPAAAPLALSDESDDPAMIARMVRAIWQVPPGPIFNVTKMLEDNGCIIVSHNFGTRSLDGFSYHSVAMPPIFHLNAVLPPDRWRWTLAHELGHIVLHSEIGATGAIPKQAEQEADAFAGEFLAPAHELKPMLWNLDIPKLAGLKREWKISMQALVMQAYRLGVINNRHRQSLFLRMSKAGYRQREPEVLDPPIEVPSRSFDLVKFHLTELEYTREELKEHLAVGEDDFRAYYRDPHDFVLA